MLPAMLGWRGLHVVIWMDTLPQELEPDPAKQPQWIVEMGCRMEKKVRFKQV